MGAGMLVSLGQIGQEGLGLVRNIILARALGPAEMGLVAAVSLVGSLLETISDLGPDRLLIQSAEGNRPAFQGTCHSLLVVRGVVCAVLLAILAVPASRWIGRSDALWMLLMMSILPLLRGWLHLDGRRVQREGRFGIQVVTELSATAAGTLAAWGLVRLVPRAETLVWANLIQVGLLLLLSHLLAERRYELHWQRTTARQLWQFGWPLALNSLVMFAAMQGDRMVAVSAVPAADLGRLTMAFQITLVPALLISRIASTLWLPELSQFQKSRGEFQPRFDQIATILACVGLLFALGIQWGGNFLLRIFFGESYLVSASLLGWLGITQGIRILRALPSLAAMSRADSRNPLIANLLRSTGILASIGTAIAGWGMEAIVICGCLGEAVALVGSLWLLNKRHAISLQKVWRPMCWFATGVIGGGLVLHQGGVDSGWGVIALGIAGGSVWLLGRDVVGQRLSVAPVTEGVATGQCPA
jgi:O-antigen/teichoic acid export membrane protein